MAERSHRTQSTERKLLALAAANRRDDVVRGHCGLSGRVLSGWRTRATAGCGYLRAIAHRPDAFGALDLEELAGDQPSILAFRQVQSVDERMREARHCRY